MCASAGFGVGIVMLTIVADVVGRLGKLLRVGDGKYLVVVKAGGTLFL